MNHLNGFIIGGENKSVEFKQDYSKTLLKTISAFANYHTGRLLVGIDDGGHIIGVPDIEKMRLTIENAINDGIYPRPYFELRVYSIEGKDILEIKVFKGEQTPYTFNNKAYKRSDTASVEVDRIGYEELILAGRNLSFEELDSNLEMLIFETLEKKIYQKMNIAHLNRDLLVTLELIKKDRYNKAAELLSDQNSIKTAVVSMVKYDNENISMMTDRIRLENCSILNQFDQAIEFFKKHTMSRELIHSEVRTKVEAIPLVAYREAIANAIVHRDYSRQGDIRIEIYKDNIQIVSPGGLPMGITTEEYLDGRLSIPRNRILTEIFFRIGLIEKLATGVRRIKEQYQYSFSKPIFSVMDNSIKITLPFIQLEEKLIVPTNEKNPKYSQIIKHMEEFGHITRKEAEKIIGLSKTQTYEVLKNMIDEHRIILIGKGPGTRYVLNKINL